MTTTPTPRTKYDVLVVSGEMIATVAVRAHDHRRAEREAVTVAERAYPSRLFVAWGAAKCGNQSD
jgi:hypothetical protein